MDYDYWSRIAKRYRIVYLSTYLANSRLHRDTKTLADQIAVHDEILHMLRRYYGRVSPRWLYAAACSTLTAKLMPHIQGMYHDGWASQWVRLFPPHTARDYPDLELQGIVPTRLLPLSLQVTSGNQVVHKSESRPRILRCAAPGSPNRLDLTDVRPLRSELPRTNPFARKHWGYMRISETKRILSVVREYTLSLAGSMIRVA